MHIQTKHSWQLPDSAVTPELSLTPLRVLFPRSAIVNALNRHRRYIGVSACIYGLIHFSCHVLYQGDWEDLLQSFTERA